MISYLDLLELGIHLEGAVIGPPLDYKQRFLPTNGTLKAKGPQEHHAVLVAAVQERMVLARVILSGRFKFLSTPYGHCDTCDCKQEAYKMGMCLLCQAALQKARQERANPPPFVPRPPLPWKRKH